MACGSSHLVIGCLVLIFFATQQVSSETCAPIDKDINILKDQNFWTFEVPHVEKGCIPFKPPISGGNVTSTCVFYFSLCHPVPSLCTENCGICLTNKVSFWGHDYDNKALYTMPKKTGGFDPNKKVNFDSERDYFTLIYEPGELTNASTLSSFQTEITFHCNKSAVWKRSDGESGNNSVTYPPKVTVSSTQIGVVMVKVEFEYSGACSKGGGGGGKDDEPSKPLSVGSIMLILFFPGVFLYCVVGVLVNKGAGKTGKEMIPNSKFWSDLPGLIADGFSFVVAKITCSQMTSSRQSYNSM
ncbi:hypothetical protein pdam_00023102 [Pocillopora damicornis]|uniref:Autophagy-related protein 27 n=1 Tax=Pocillopora damicornis TaxID=46731 RepID=A0A3M6T773_POCDA|nr:hypothetical protein pdam_00023102 [Pocillopora damicornis]